MHGVRLRLARVDDARAIGVLVRRLTRHYILPDQPVAAAPLLLATMTAASIRRRMLAGFRFHVAEVGDTVVGVIATRDDCHVHHLFVATRHQRKGIARALWRRALADCRRRARPSRITVNASAFAVPAYRRMGFVATGAAHAHPDGVITTPMVWRADNRMRD